MSTDVRRFDPPGLLALEPRAFGVVIGQVKAPVREVQYIGQAAVVSVVGPLEHHKGEGYLDSYEDIERRVAEAFNSDAKAVVLKIDSPGGLVAGCFAAALGIRAKREVSGKPLLAYVSGGACSAGYALASPADRIVLARGASVGSVGIIDARLDLTKQDAALGMRYAFITSGDRKAYGNPHLPLTDDELAVRQSMVDAHAALFFDLVAAWRPTTAQKLKALEAGVFSGGAAIERGLADAEGSFEELLASIAGDQTPSAMETPMSARKALEEAAKGDGEEAKKAKRALAAWDKDEEASDESDEKTDDEEASDESDEKTDDEKKDEEAKAPGATASAAAAPAASSDAIAELRAGQVSLFLDSRPDLTPEQRASLQDLPLAKVRAIVSAIPRPTKKPNHTAGITPSATRAEGQSDRGNGNRSPASDPDEARVDRLMGLSSTNPGKCEMRGNTFYMGRAPEPDQV